MKSLTLKTKASQTDGMMSAVTLDLQTLAPVEVVAVHFSTLARLIVCDSVPTQQRLIGDAMRDPYQMMTPVPAGVLFEVCSIVYFPDFDLTRPATHADQRRLLRFPQDWQPVKLRSATGSLPCVIEVRAGNAKHKVQPIIDIYIK